MMEMCALRLHHRVESIYTTGMKNKAPVQKVPCPVCHKDFHPQGLGVHMKMHRQAKPVTDPPSVREDDEIILIPIKLSFVRMLLLEALRPNGNKQ